MTNKNNVAQPEKQVLVNAISLETFVCLALLVGSFVLIGNKMGVANMFGTAIATAYDLLIGTVFFIMALAVVAGGAASFMAEFGVVALINKIISPLMRPLYNLPGAAVLGIIVTFLSDNPAIVALGKERNFIKYFTYSQRALLTNLGTTFGMGIILSTFMIAQAKDSTYLTAVGVGVGSAALASIISVRIMSIFCKKYYGPLSNTLVDVSDINEEEYDLMKYRKIREGSVGYRALSSLLDGGKSGVDLGISLAPGVLIICTVVMMLVFGPNDETGAYTGKAYEGIALIPLIAQKIEFILTPLFGFSSPEAIAFPCVAIGAVGGAMGLVPSLLAKGLIGANDIAVFTAIGMCWSGYLSTHIAMMDVLGARGLAGKGILSHTIAGLCAGMMANWIFHLVIAL